MKLDKVAGGSATNIGMQFKDAILNYQTGVSDSNNVITMNPRDTLAFYEGGAQVLKQGNMFQYDCNFTYPDWADAKHLQFRIFYMKNMDTTLNIAQSRKLHASLQWRRANRTWVLFSFIIIRGNPMFQVQRPKSSFSRPGMLTLQAVRQMVHFHRIYLHSEFQTAGLTLQTRRI